MVPLGLIGELCRALTGLLCEDRLLNTFAVPSHITSGADLIRLTLCLEHIIHTSVYMYNICTRKGLFLLTAQAIVSLELESSRSNREK